MENMKLNPLSRAFTLIEVLVALTLFSIVFLSMFEAYSYVLSIHTQLSRQRSLQETSRSTATFMAQKIETLGLDGDAMQSLTHS
jgi:prepilin-type N-terminal cleavage/methylation domain-containing protein